MEQVEHTVVFNRKSVSSKRKIRKRTYEESSSDDETTKQNEPCKNSLPDKGYSVNIDNLSVAYKSSQNALPIGPKDQGATACLQTETETDKDARASFERSIKLKEELKGKNEDGIYRGLSSYVNMYDNTKENALRQFYNGPTRAPINIRPTCQWDYQPDICKDFKETGFCGFGDSCKFLHDRTDYKYGWEMEQNRAKQQTEEEAATNYEIDCSNEDGYEGLPFKCFICRNSFVNPIVTKCLHYFCEKCALVRFKKNMRCAICNKQTNGIFNPAYKLINKLKTESS